jgi:hypothetical protein
MTQTAKDLAANLTFGVELEVIFRGSQQALADAINAAGVACEAQYYNHNVCRVWKVVSDASVAGGWEVVSPVLTADRFDEVAKVCEALKAVGATVDVTCGMHVHVGVQGFLTETQIRNLVKMFVIYEGAMDTMVPASRRNSRWAQGFTTKSLTSVNDAIRRINAAGSLREVYSAICRNGRYHKLNLDSYWRQGTVEFRQHSGTIEAEKVLTWIKLCLGFVARSATSTEVKANIQSDDPATCRTLLLRGVFGKSGTTPDAAAMRFLQKRAKALAA